MGLNKFLFKLFANNSVYAVMVAQTQCTPAPGAQETLFALHDSLGRLNILHSPPISLNRFLSFQTNPRASHYTIWHRKGIIFFPPTCRSGVFIFHSSALHCTAKCLMASHSWSGEWAGCCGTGGHSAFTGSLFYLWSTTYEFQRTFLQNLIFYFPQAVLKRAEIGF